MARNPFEPYTDPEEYKIPEPPPPGPPIKHEDVVARVRELVGKYPTIGSRQLYDLAVRMHPDLETHGFRSFHARYVLPLKREKAREEGRVPKRRKAQPEAAPAPARKRGTRMDRPVAAEPTIDQSALRGRVREVLLRLAREVAVAESRADLVDALARVEGMVDEVVAAAQPAAEPAAEASAS